MQKREKSRAIPLPGSLGLLAQGAQGLRAWRKRRAEEENEAPREKD